MTDSFDNNLRCLNHRNAVCGSSCSDSYTRTSRRASQLRAAHHPAHAEAEAVTAYRRFAKRQRLEAECVAASRRRLSELERLQARHAVEEARDSIALHKAGQGTKPDAQLMLFGALSSQQLYIT